jgi:hypothetical protein
MERIQAVDCVILKSNVVDDELYRIIVGCIKTYVHALKLVSLYMYDVPREITETRQLFLLSTTLKGI